MCRIQILYFNPRSPYGERPCSLLLHKWIRCISIHAPLTGSDRQVNRRQWGPHDFNPHSPYGERPVRHASRLLLPGFQSTLPLRGATAGVAAGSTMIPISTPPPGGGGAGGGGGKNGGGQGFQPTPPLRGATVFLPPFFPPFDYFNPRSPYGERPADRIAARRRPGFQSTLPLRGATKRDQVERIKFQFQSTLPLRGATCARQKYLKKTQISIHAPLTGSDSNPKTPGCGPSHFNPRSPYGERLYSKSIPFILTAISIHAPLTGSDLKPRHFHSFP